jgi:ferrous iron transport protein B
MPAFRDVRSRTLTVAVVGNPNSGKTTLFNALTGANAKIGNYPGITVERRTGFLDLSHSGRVELIDVPGTYSLTARSLDEEVAINVLLGRKGLHRPDAALLVLDCTALERNLYFLLQVMEFEIPVIAVLNMHDAAREEGIEIDLAAFQEIFRTPVVTTSARRRLGVDQVKQELDTLLAGLDSHTPPGWFWTPDPDLARDLDELEEAVAEEVRFSLPSANSRRAFALWLLMSLQAKSELVVRPRLRSLTLAIQQRQRETGFDLETATIGQRYAFIDSVAPRLIRRAPQPRASRTDRIDAVLTHPLWGSLVFLTIMGAIFQALFSWSEPAMNLVENSFARLASGIESIAPAGFVRDLITEGVIAGVGGVVVFLPQILFLFLFITILEGSGYLSRAAFLIDRLMRRVGLPGQAFVPMLSGFACAIPAIMATRTIENRRDRMLTIMVVPLISCSARLPVFILIIALLFPADHKIGFLSVGSLMMLGLYLLSTLLSLSAVAVLGRTVLKGRRQPMLLELPPYRLPDPKTVLMTLWERARVFLTTAGTIILTITVVLWFLLSFPRTVDLTPPPDLSLNTPGVSPPVDTSVNFVTQQQQDGSVPNVDHATPTQTQTSDLSSAARLKHSYAGRLGSLLEPLLAPLGFDWKIGIGLVGAFAAREVFVSTMGVIYGIGDDADQESTGLRAAMRRDRRPDGSPLWTPLVGASLLIFFLIAMQCMSTLAVTRRETSSWKWTTFMLLYLTGSAYFASLLVYQGGRLAGLG